MPSLRGLSVRTCLTYLREKILEKAREDAWRSYIADNLMMIGQNTAKYAGGSYMKTKYSEIINPKPVETRTGDEIIAGMKEKLARLGGE